MLLKSNDETDRVISAHTGNEGVSQIRVTYTAMFWPWLLQGYNVTEGGGTLKERTPQGQPPLVSTWEHEGCLCPDKGKHTRNVEIRP